MIEKYTTRHQWLKLPIYTALTPTHRRTGEWREFIDGAWRYFKRSKRNGGSLLQSRPVFTAWGPS